MPAWLISLILSFGLPALKALLVVLLRALEKAMPGIAPLVEAIIQYIQGGAASACELHDHLCKTVPNFPAPPKKDA